MIKRGCVLSRSSPFNAVLPACGSGEPVLFYISIPLLSVCLETYCIDEGVLLDGCQNGHRKKAQYQKI